MTVIKKISSRQKMYDSYTFEFRTPHTSLSNFKKQTIAVTTNEMLSNGSCTSRMRVLPPLPTTAEGQK